ncbi:leucine-rich repeat domain-containing protein [Psychrobacter alimentarius]|uniref:leucine-rich repeat domain-containing protein n=1 Tax=Psychrobacter alimentarius TaxID=261164 RepID=UPI003FCF21D9
MTNNTTTEPWMTELWAWADKFEISEEVLPRNREGLLTITDLDIRSNQLTELSESIGQLIKLRRLVVSNNQIDRLPDSIGKLINLEFLDISDNPLTTLPESIVQLKRLEFITIAKDGSIKNLVSLPVEVTDFLYGLKYGCIGWNDPIKRSNSIREYLRRQQSLNQKVVLDKDTDDIALESIDREALQEVIKWADLCDLPICTISRDPEELANHTSLSIDSYTQPLPKAIGCLTQLRNLTLNDCMSPGSEAYQAVDILPNTIVNLVNLETLSLVCRGLAFLPTNLHELKSLKTLKITYYDVITIPKVLAEMSCDIELHLHINQDKLPDYLLDDLTDMSSLTELSISDKGLKITPTTLHEIKSLKILEITFHDVITIPKILAKVSCNIKLHLNSNQDRLSDYLLDGLADTCCLTELSINGECLTILPDNINQLTSLKALKVTSGSLKRIPKSIGALSHLTNLTLNCEALEYLPESLGQLSQLESLTITSDRVKQLPESFARLTSLGSLNIATHLSNQLPTTLMNKYLNGNLYIERMAFTTLYTPQAANYGLSEVGFVVIEDGWEQQSLLDLKQQVGCALVALQTTDKCVDRFEVIDCIIICKSDEVEQVMTVFESVLSARKHIGIDFNDIRRCCGAEKPAKFIQTTVTDVSDSERLESTVNHLLNQIPKNINIEDIMLDIASDHKLSLNEMVAVNTAVESRTADDSEIFYGSRVIGKLNHCWMGAIYVAG